MPFPSRAALRFGPLALASLLFAASCGGGESTTASASSSGSGGAAGSGGTGGDVPQIPYPTGDLLSFPLDKTGPFNVGYRSFEITYQPPGQKSPRTIGINIWYPTLDASGTAAVYRKIFQDPDVFVDARLAAPVDPSGYPVHVYSHGSWGFGATSSDLMHHFASHGWVAIAPDHTGNTLGIPADKIPVSLHYLRSTDISAALDTLETLDAKDPLAGRARTERVVMSGHSFGTLTTWASGGATFDPAAIQAKCDAGEFSDPCTPEELAVFATGVTDPRVVAGIPMAGDKSDWFSQGGYDAPMKPFMLMTGSEDVSGQGVFDAVTSIDFTWLEFEGGCHQLFALGGCPHFDTALGYAIIDTYALAFARRHVLGDASDDTAKILAGQAPVSMTVTLQHEGPTSPPAGP